MCNGPYDNPNLSAAFHHRKTIVLTKKKVLQHINLQEQNNLLQCVGNKPPNMRNYHN